MSTERYESTYRLLVVARLLHQALDDLVDDAIVLDELDIALAGEARVEDEGGLVDDWGQGSGRRCLRHVVHRHGVAQDDWRRGGREASDGAVYALIRCGARLEVTFLCGVMDVRLM